MPHPTRREFLRESSLAVAAGAWLAPANRVAKAAASERVRVGIMGAGGRALSLTSPAVDHPPLDGTLAGWTVAWFAQT